jgi:cytidine deaminase
MSYSPLDNPSDHPSGLTQKQIERLLALAAQAAANSYSPYSRFRVGAAILLTDGTEVTGTNVENASYRLTTCAEQSAICSAVGLHGPNIRIRAVAVANLNGSASMPCGACRQTILEFANPETHIFYPNTGGEPTFSTLAGLLPHAFHLEHLPE